MAKVTRLVSGVQSISPSALVVAAAVSLVTALFGCGDDGQEPARALNSKSAVEAAVRDLIAGVNDRDVKRVCKHVPLRDAALLPSRHATAGAGWPTSPCAPSPT
jgi:hypothetical protein